ncbi:unnamed protein product [Blepharisma stoltei]|uniref:Gustatory receptor n=1 Tax=Blepharisma stoltei TaxID=1481888 RepID=A0AAU9J9S6_9CILI|nr:unnamed protein product [Blepharisma stoltei]
MKRSSTLQDIPKFINTAVSPAGLFVSITSNSISHVMRTTKGKEKLLALAQYSSELYKLTMFDYLKANKIQEWPIKVKNFHEIEKSMKNGRKLMRVLMFFDELNVIEKIWTTNRTLDFVKILRILAHFASTVYYILDNLVWLADIGIISKFISTANIRWKDTKDISCIARCILQFTIDFITAIRTNKHIKAATDILQENSTKVIHEKDEKYQKLVENLIDCRRELRFKKIDIIVTILRFLMLAKALNFPWTKGMSHIFVAICGVCSNSLSIFNILIAEPVVRIEAKQAPESKDKKLNLIS